MCLNLSLIQLVLQFHQICVKRLIFLINHFAKLFNLIKVDLVGEILVQMLIDTVKDAAQLQSVLLTQILSLVELISTILHLAVKLTVAGAQLLKSSDVHLCILLVLLHLADLLILHPLSVRLKLNFMRELVLNDIVHLSLDLRAFLLALRDELRYAVIGCDENSTAAFEQLCLERLVGALIRLTIKLHLHPLDLTDQVGLLVSV